MKSLLLLALVSFGLQASQFTVIKHGQQIPVRSEHLDSILRTIDTEQDLAAYVQAGNGFRAYQDEEGNYRLESRIGLRGGGPILATIGFVGVHTAGFTLMFTSMLGVNIVLPGVGTTATLIAGGGSLTTWMAAQNALAVKACCAGALAVPWL